MATKKFSADDISQIAGKLHLLPEVTSSPTNTKAEAIQKLTPEIEKLRARGYTFNQISEALTENGIEISTPTLKNYLYRGTKVAKKATKKKPLEKQFSMQDTTRTVSQKNTPDFTPASDSEDI